MQTAKLNNEAKVSFDNVADKVAKRKEAGLISGGAGFEPPLPIADGYVGKSLGTFDIIEFVYKSGANAGKVGFMVLVNLDYEGTPINVPVNDSDLHLYNVGESVTFDVHNDKNGVKRTRVNKTIVSGDMNVNGSENTELADLEKQAEELEAKIAATTSARTKASLQKQLDAIDEKIAQLA